MRGPQTTGAAGEPAIGRQELAWLHALARRLAASETDADDLVQETFMHADGPGRPRPGDGRSWRAWLAGVLRNRERMQRRSEGRRRRREADAALEVGAAPDTELLIHRDRVLSSLREVLDELDEDDRALLVARYCDEHAAPELADRLGIPASTVRSRLSRATTRVRQRLDERWGGDRRGWAPAVLAAPMAGPSSAVVDASGATFMSVKLVKIILALVMATVATTIWIATRDDDVATAVEQGEADAEAEHAARLRARRDESGAEEVATLVGTVVDADSRQPIAGATVAISTVSGAPGIPRPGGASTMPRAATDDTGRFAVDDLPAGAYHVTAAAPGYLPGEIEGLRLSAEGRDAPVLALHRGGNRLDGVLTDIGGGPIEGAWVVARQSGDVNIGAHRAGYVARSDAEGGYALSLPDGHWSIEAGGDDYTVALQRVSMIHGPARADFQLVPAAAIHGRVVDRTSGEPIPGAVVAFERFARSGGSFSVDASDADDVAVCDANGVFTLRPLEPATYSLYATAPGKASIVEAVVPVDIAERITGVEVTVDPAFDATGFVVDAAQSERGLSGVAVQVFSTKPSRHWFATTASDGSFDIHGITPGVYHIMFEGEGVVPSAMEHSLRVDPDGAKDRVFPLQRGVTVRGRIAPATAATVKVAGRETSGGLEVMLAGQKVKHAHARVRADGTFAIDGVALGAWKVVATGDDGSTGSVEVEVAAADVDGVDIALQPSASVHGIVRTDDGSTIPGLAVRLEKDNGGPFGPRAAGTGTSDAKGRFEIVGAAADEYRIAVVDAAGQPVELVGGDTKVTLADAAQTELDLRVRLPRGRITGIVRAADGGPVADAFVVATPNEAARIIDRSLPVLTDADGRFVVEGLANRLYTVYARGPGESGKASVVDVSTGADVELELVMLGRVRGRVTMGGAPVERFELSDGEMRRARTFIAADGSFALDRVETGKQRLSITSDAGGASVTVEVEPGETSDVDVELGAWGTVKGRLVSASDRSPLADVSIVVDASAGMRQSAIDNVFDRSAATTDAEGRFEIEGVGPGIATLRFNRGNALFAGEGLGAHRFELAPGETHELGEVVALPPLAVPKAERGWLGLEIRGGAGWDGKAIVRDADAPLHVYVTGIPANGPAAALDVRVGDRIVAVDDFREDDVGGATLLDAARPARVRVGTTYRLGILRGDTTHAITVTAVAQPR
jgi:RNA polymerase sigma-70 factor (ECF subfamily)